MGRRIESFFISGPAGRLEAMLEEPGHSEPTAAALVCHPHPLHGGTMHNKVVHRLARGLRKAGCAVLRFNFRGVNLSEGEHDHGKGETLDALACLKELRGRYPGLPFLLAGFSFGSRVALKVACHPDGALARRVLVAGFPTVYRTFWMAEQCRVYRVFVHSTHDEHGPRKQLQALFDRLWEPKRLVWIESKDHFFVDKLDEFEHAVTEAGQL
jgi:alpha/beta superfamily hydrolase